MATSNAQLTKLAIGITAVAALAAITGSLSAGAAPSTNNTTAANDAAADPTQAQGQQITAPRSSGTFGFSWGDDDDEEEGEEHEHEGEHSRLSPQFAVPGTGTNAGTVAPRTRSKHS